MTTPADAFADTLRACDAHLSDVLQSGLGERTTRSMTDAALLTLAQEIESLGRRIDAARIAVAGEIAERSRAERGETRLCTRRGCANAADLLCRITGVATSTAKMRIATARVVRGTAALDGSPVAASFPVLGEAFLAGMIGFDSAAAIAQVLGPIADRCDRRELGAAELELVGAATGIGDAPACGADETRIQAKVWALVLDPDGSLPDHERAHRHRALTLGRERDGLVPLSGALVPDVAEQLRRLFDAQLSPRVASTNSPTPPSTPHGPRFLPSTEGEHRADRGSHTADDEAPEDPRTRTQKQHDAFAAILGVAARSAESPLIGGAPPTLLVTIAASDLDRDGSPGAVDGTEAIVPAVVARHIACSGGIQRLVLGDDGRIIELGGPQRVFSAAQRRAITARDGGCVIPGCEVPSAWCEIHHVVEHSRGGPTHTDNGAMLCWHHHRTLESSGWAVRMLEGMPQTRAPAWFDPTGRWRTSRGSTLRRRDEARRRLAASAG